MYKYSPSNSVHSSPITKRKKKYRNNNKHNNNATTSSSESEMDYPNTNTMNTYERERHSKAIITNNHRRKNKNKNKKKKKGIKMNEIHTHSPPFRNNKIHSSEYRNYINIDIPTNTPMNATINATQPLKEQSNKLLLKNDDTLTKLSDKTIHKTVDLPSPVYNKNNNKNALTYDHKPLIIAISDESEMYQQVNDFVLKSEG